MKAAAKATARLFRNGGSQAIRLPKEFRFPGRTVTLQRTRRGLLVTAPKDDLARRARLFASLAGSCPDFPEIKPNLAPDVPRVLFDE